MTPKSFYIVLKIKVKLLILVQKKEQCTLKYYYQNFELYVFCAINEFDSSLIQKCLICVLFYKWRDEINYFYYDNLRVWFVFIVQIKFYSMICCFIFCMSTWRVHLFIRNPRIHSLRKGFNITPILNILWSPLKNKLFLQIWFKIHQDFLLIWHIDFKLFCLLFKLALTIISWFLHIKLIYFYTSNIYILRLWDKFKTSNSNNTH